jgi:hypothetical protein
VKLVRTGNAGVLLLQRWRSGRSLPFGRKPERNSSVSTTFNVRGLSLPDQTALSRGAILIGCSYLFIARW